jgi:hypothetical protein
MTHRLEAAERVCEWLDNLCKMDASDDLRGRALRDTGMKLVDDWKMTCVSTARKPDRAIGKKFAASNSDE